MLSKPACEVFAAWIVTVFILAVGLSLLAFHERGVPGAVVPQWYEPPVVGTEEWDNAACRGGTGTCLGELSTEDDDVDPMTTPSIGSSAPMCFAGEDGRRASVGIPARVSPAVCQAAGAANAVC